MRRVAPCKAEDFEMAYQEPIDRRRNKTPPGLGTPIYSSGWNMKRLEKKIFSH